MIVILGAGLAGLSTALHLKNIPWTVYEAEGEVGGLCRTVQKDGFTFDYTGHLLYLHHEPVKALMRDLFAAEMHALRRSAWIRSHGVDLPFPFQVNTRGLPLKVRVDCITGFMDAHLKAKDRAPSKSPRLGRGVLDFLELKELEGMFEHDMESWVLETFGTGFAEHFFRPYNEKFWRRPLKELTAEWAWWSIPVPKLAEVIRGALALEVKGFGYNTNVLYPKEGGIRLLPETLFDRLEEGAPVHLGRRAVSLEAGARKVRFQDGEEVAFESLVSSIPLNRLVGLIEDAPAEVRDAASRLESVSVFGVNVGFKGGFDHEKHWTYFPEEDYVFYRIGFISNYSPSMAPEGHASLTAEVARRPDEPVDDDLEDKVLEDLVRAGLLKEKKDAVFVDTLRIDPAYVVFNKARQAALPLIYEYLMRNKIIPVGRYGTWNYLGMEDSILHGIQAAGRIMADASAGG